MPIISIRAPMPDNEDQIQTMINDVRQSAAVSIQTPLSNVWVLFEPFSKSYFLPNGNDEDSYVPIVIVKATTGRPQADKKALALAVTGAVSRGLSISPDRVWLQYEDVSPSNIWFGKSSES